MCTRETIGSFTIVTCRGSLPPRKDGVVKKNESDLLRYRVTATSAVGGPICLEWYGDVECTQFLCYGMARPVIEGQESVDGRQASVTLILRHAAQEWDHDLQQPKAGTNLGPIEGKEVHYALPNVLHPPEALSEDVFDAPGIQWEPLDPFALANTADTKVYPLGEIARGHPLLFRFYSEDPPDEGVRDYEILRICVLDMCIPTVSEWGMVVIALLILGAGTVVIRRRRAMAA